MWSVHAHIALVDYLPGPALGNVDIIKSLGIKNYGVYHLNFQTVYKLYKYCNLHYVAPAYVFSSFSSCATQDKNLSVCFYYYQKVPITKAAIQRKDIHVVMVQMSISW